MKIILTTKLITQKMKRKTKGKNVPPAFSEKKRKYYEYSTLPIHLDGQKQIALNATCLNRLDFNMNYF